MRTPWDHMGFQWATHGAPMGCPWPSMARQGLPWKAMGSPWPPKLLALCRGSQCAPTISFHIKICVLGIHMRFETVQPVQLAQPVQPKWWHDML